MDSPVITNCTHHPVTVAETTYFPSGIIVKVKFAWEEIAPNTYGWDIKNTSIENLPPESERGSFFIVSFMTAMVIRVLHPARNDFISPDTSPQHVVKSPSGQIVGSKRFVIW